MLNSFKNQQCSKDDDECGFQWFSFINLLFAGCQYQGNYHYKRWVRNRIKGLTLINPPYVSRNDVRHFYGIIFFGIFPRCPLRN